MTDYGLAFTITANLAISNIHGVPCNTRSNISKGLISSPDTSIDSFCQTWGSGLNGANPKVRHRIIIRDKGILFSITVR